MARPRTRRRSDLIHRPTRKGEKAPLSQKSDEAFERSQGDERLRTTLCSIAEAAEQLAGDAYRRHGLDPALVRKGSDWTRGDDELDWADELLVKANNYRGLVHSNFEFLSPLLTAFATFELCDAIASYQVEFGLGPALGPGLKYHASRVRNREQQNSRLHRERLAEWNRWQTKAEEIWRRRPALKKNAVARMVKESLKLPDRVGTIAARIKKPPEA